MGRKIFTNPRRQNQQSEWSSTEPQRHNRLLKFEIALLAISAVAAFAVYVAKVLPLSAGPVSPPPGVSLAWAGQQLRGYSETNYIAAEDCDKPVRVLLDLYRLGVPPEPAYAQVRRPGKVAFAIVGDPRIKPDDVRIWAPRPGQETGIHMLYEAEARLPPLFPTRAQIQRDPSTGEQESIVFTFNWNPITQSHIEVFLESDWLSPRTSDRSCWLTVPGQLGDALNAVDPANAAIGHAEWTRSSLGQPLSNAGTWVNKDGAGKLLVNSSASIPTPSSIDPASWRCGLIVIESSCRAAVVLEPPNAEAAHSKSLVIWSTVGGILLSISGAAFTAAIREAMRS
jgi:hypothetical protein